MIVLRRLPLMLNLVPLIVSAVMLPSALASKKNPSSVSFTRMNGSLHGRSNLIGFYDQRGYVAPDHSLPISAIETGFGFERTFSRTLKAEANFLYDLEALLTTPREESTASVTWSPGDSSQWEISLGRFATRLSLESNQLGQFEFDHHGLAYDNYVDRAHTGIRVGYLFGDSLNLELLFATPSAEWVTNLAQVVASPRLEYRMSSDTRLSIAYQFRENSDNQVRENSDLSRSSTVHLGFESKGSEWSLETEAYWQSDERGEVVPSESEEGVYLVTGRWEAPIISTAASIRLGYQLSNEWKLNFRLEDQYTRYSASETSRTDSIQMNFEQSVEPQFRIRYSLANYFHDGGLSDSELSVSGALQF